MICIWQALLLLSRLLAQSSESESLFIGASVGRPSLPAPSMPGSYRPSEALPWYLGRKTADFSSCPYHLVHARVSVYEVALLTTGCVVSVSHLQTPRMGPVIGTQILAKLRTLPKLKTQYIFHQHPSDKKEISILV